MFESRRIQFSFQSHQNLSPFHLHWELAVDQRFAGLVLAGAHVELPAVPGAGDDAALELSLAKRAALVRADAVEGVDGAVDIEEGHNPVAGDAFLGGARREFAFGGGWMPGSHSFMVTSVSGRGQPCRRTRSVRRKCCMRPYRSRSR